MVIALLAALAVGMIIIRKAMNTNTAFMAIMALCITMSALIAFNAVSFIGGIIASVLICLAIIWLDNARIMS